MERREGGRKEGGGEGERERLREREKSTLRMLCIIFVSFFIREKNDFHNLPQFPALHKIFFIIMIMHYILFPTTVSFGITPNNEVHFFHGLTKSNCLNILSLYMYA